jgi:acyl carrier protein
VLRDELVSFLIDQGVDLPAESDTVPLFEMALLDSLALFNLVLWIEERIGTPIDPTSLDIAHEWGSVRDILAFVNARVAER